VLVAFDDKDLVRLRDSGIAGMLVTRGERAQVSGLVRKMTRLR
jgi:hypothetical protein